MLAEKTGAVVSLGDPLVAPVRKLSRAVIGSLAVAPYAAGAAAHLAAITIQSL